MFETQIKKGIALLKHQQIHSVNTTTLDMVSHRHCVLGQLYGTYVKGVVALRLYDENERIAHGFTVGAHTIERGTAADSLFAVLTQEWRDMLCQSRS